MSMAHLFTNIDALGVVSLGTAEPDKPLLKKTADIMLQSTKALLESGDVGCLRYGPRRGDSEALKELAKFLTSVYQDEVKSANLIFNAGATQGLKFLSESLFDVGDLVLFEDPTFFTSTIVLTKDSGLRPMAVSTEDDGINVDELDRILTEHVKGKTLTSSRPYSALVYLVPTFNNPKGTILSEEKSKRLIQVLRKHKALAVCDDVYNTLSFIDDKPPLVTPPPKRLFAYDSEADPDYQGNVVSNSTFSKILGPGLRLGWMEVPQHLLSMFEAKSGYLFGGGCFNHYTSCVIREALKLGLVSKHLAEVREVYQSRKNAMCDAIDKFIPMAKYLRPKGGCFVWVALPEHINTNDVLTICKKYKIAFRPGTYCSCFGNFQNCMRLCFANDSEDVLSETVRKIGMVINDLSCNKN